MTDPEYNCSNCKTRYIRSPERQHKHQERKGCFNTFPDALLKYSGTPGTPMAKASKIAYYKCPALLYSSYWASIINLSYNYEKGSMPYEGNLLDQPAQIVEAFNLIHNLKEETRIKQQQVLEKYGKRSKR